MVNVALLGIGNMGRNHLRILNMLKGVNISFIFDVDEKELEKLSKQYDVSYTTEIDVAIDSADAVLIVTPTSTHYDYFNHCVGKVKYVFIEKPLAATLDQGRKIKALAEQHSMVVQCGFIERFNPVVTELNRIMHSEDVINADFTRTNRLSSRINDVDVVLDLMIHDIDLALYLNGEVKNVVAFGKKENGIIAFASALLHHKNGALSRVLASRMTEKKIRSIQITTGESYIDCNLLRKEVIIHKQTQEHYEENKPYVISSMEQQVQVMPQEALLSELQAFISVCNGENVSYPNLQAGFDSLELSDAILSQIEKSID
jgi:predicted dehydrogenase